MIANIGANTFLIFMAFDILATIFCYFFVKETRGKNLELAAGTEWQVAEKLADHGSESEKGQSNPDESKSTVLIDEATGKKLKVIDVRDTFAS